MILRILIFLIVLLFSVPAWSGQVIKVGVGHFPPWVYSAGSELKGADKELMIEIFKKMGVGYEFKYLTFNQILEGLKDGKIDIASGLLYREERDSYIQYISPPLRTKDPKAFYYLKKTKLRINKYKDIFGYRLGVCKGLKYFPVFDMDRRFEKVPSKHLENSLKLLVQGKVDIVISSELLADYQIREMGLQRQIAKADFRYDPRSIPIYLGMSRKSVFLDRSEELGAILRYFQKNGEQKRLVEKYLGSKAAIYLQ